MNLLAQDTRPDSDYRTIPLTQGKFAIVDAADFDWLSRWKWSLLVGRDRFYAHRTQIIDGKQVNIPMHRFILGVDDPSIEVDHQDGDGLHNWRRNLRPCTTSQNQQNRKRAANNTSGFVGVGKHKATNKWVAYIKIDGKQRHLGLFDSVLDAVVARDAAAAELYGEFARPNIAVSGGEL